MAARKILVAVLLLGVVAVASFTAYVVYFMPGQPTCQAIQGGSFARSPVQRTTFGAVTEYKLPSMDRLPSAITVAPDGSVWFAEQELPGVARLLPNSTAVVEYAWPGYPTPRLPDCLQSVSTSGIAVWNGRVWATDEYGNLTIGLNPADGSTISVNSTREAPFPYWLAVGPDGNLWFTSNNLPGQPARLGRILPDMTLNAIALNGLGQDQPVQLDFVNSSLAYFSAINESTNSTTKTCICTGHVYSFDPETVASSVPPKKVGGDHALILPTSVAYADGGIWVAQHGTSSIAEYNLTTDTWKEFPTSRVTWSSTTLPLMVEASGGKVWYNEHLGNKIAMLDPRAGTLTEYSESNPPASNGNGVQNDLSIAAAGGGTWFTSMTGNYVGFVNSDLDPGLHVAVSGAGSSSVAPGGNASFVVRVAGTWSGPMKVNVSDSENPESLPQSIKIVPSASVIQPGAISFDLGVNVEVGATVRPGSFSVAVTITDGTIQQTAYMFVIVG